MNWECTKCDAWLVGPENRLHNCPGMGGLGIYFTLKGASVNVESHEREDYINGDLVQVDGHGRPIMSVTTTRDEGMDTIVYLPTATGTAKDI